jgi:thiol:disulfide interchange protein
MRLHSKTPLLIIGFLLLAGMVCAQSVSFSVSPNQLHAGDKGVLKATLTIPDQLEKKQSYDPADGQDGYLFLKAENTSFTFGRIIFPKPHHVNEDGIWVYEGSVTLSLPFSVKQTTEPGIKTIKATFGYQLCHKTKGFCDPPEEVEGTAPLEVTALPLGEDTPVSSDTAFAPAIVTQDTTKTESAPASSNTETTTMKILLYMLMAILGGIVLNVTPCVLPILPIRAMAMVRQAQNDITKVFLHTMVYTLGVLISFGAIAAVFIIARLSGANLTYGFLSQSLTYNQIMLSILFLFGLSLMDVFEMTLPGMNAAAQVTSKKGYAGSFFGGIFAFLMGFACMGPFMGPALEVAVRLSSPLLMVFFLLIGLGFALPFILIALIPKALKLVPKPGEWMNIFKETMGFLLLLLTWKYLGNVWGLTKSGDYLLKTAHYLVFLGFAAWLYGRFVKPEYKRIIQILMSVATVAIIAWSAWNYLPFKDKPAQETALQANAEGLTPSDHEGFYVFSPEVFDKLQKEGKTVFLDIGAAWCTNCKANQKKVLDQPDIRAEFKAKEVVLLYGDFTKQDAVLKEWMQKGGSIGVPFNVLYIPGKAPIKMPELFTKTDLRDALAQIPTKDTK